MIYHHLNTNVGKHPKKWIGNNVVSILLYLYYLFTPGATALWRTWWWAPSSASPTELGIIDPRKVLDLLLLVDKTKKKRTGQMDWESSKMFLIVKQASVIISHKPSIKPKKMDAYIFTGWPNIHGRFLPTLENIRFDPLPHSVLPFPILPPLIFYKI